MDIQNYPTHRTLAEKAWRKFKNKDVVRVLEPSAGEGHLIAPLAEMYSVRRGSPPPVDCIEIDMTRHAILTDNGFNVVGIDFLQFGGFSLYSHIMMNPPFASGVKHVLKAWEILFDGELVAILNAESIRNPFSAERKLLANLIEAHGSVEFLQDEFLSLDAERKTPVEIALVHLVKTCDFEIDYLGGLKVDSMTSSGLATGYKDFNDMALREGAIDNSVTIFNAAVNAAREEVFAAAKSRYYAGLLGDTLESLQARDKEVRQSQGKSSIDTVRGDMQVRYDNLKNRAWAQLLLSTQVSSRLSRLAYQRLESDFEHVKKLEFTSANIYGFITGLINKASEINLEMAGDVFDSITRFHTENRVYYKGWRSNDKHRTAAFRVKTTRFVIPGHRNEGFRSAPSWDTLRFLADFDKVFAMLDGKSEPEQSLKVAFQLHYCDLVRGLRITASYFDIRFYPGIGTIHFFPTDKKIIERLNLLIGRHRRWLPQDSEVTPKEFWLQYNNAEVYASDLHAELKRRNKSRSVWGSIERDLCSQDDAKRDRGLVDLEDSVDCVLGKHGIDAAMLFDGGLQSSAVPMQLSAMG